MERTCALWLASLMIACGRSELVSFSELDVIVEAGSGAPAPAQAQAGTRATHPAGQPEQPVDGTRWIFDGEIENARDLGGVALETG